MSGVKTLVFAFTNLRDTVHKFDWTLLSISQRNKIVIAFTLQLLIYWLHNGNISLFKHSVIAAINFSNFLTNKCS